MIKLFLLLWAVGFCCFLVAAETARENAEEEE